MLATLLPGVRDLRAPLAAGYVWLLAIYLSFGPHLPSRRAATGIWESLLILKDELSVAGLAIAVSFLAYVMGSLAEAAVGAIVSFLSVLREEIRISRSWRRYTNIFEGSHPVVPYPVMGYKGHSALGEIGRQRAKRLLNVLTQKETSFDQIIAPVQTLSYEHGPLPGALSVFEPIREVLDHAAMEILRRPARDSGAHDRTRRIEYEITGTLSRAVVTELDLMLIRLLGKENELFSAIDRLRSEAELRIAVAPSLVGLAAALAWRTTWWSAAITVAFASVFALQGRKRTGEAHDALLEAFRAGRAFSPYIERFDAALTRIEEENVNAAQLSAAAEHLYRDIEARAIDVEQSDEKTAPSAGWRHYSESEAAAAAYNLAVILERRGEHDEADEAYRRAGKRDAVAAYRHAMACGGPVHLEEADLSWRKLEYAHLEDAHLEHACLTGARLKGASLSRAHLEHANLEGARLKGAFLSGAHLEHANLEGARLKGAFLSGAHLEHANLTGARLTKASLSQAHLEHANLSDARLDRAHLYDTRFDDANLAGTRLPRGTSVGARAADEVSAARSTE